MDGDDDPSTPSGRRCRCRTTRRRRAVGMGRIVRATDRRIGRPVAIKEALSPDPGHLERFADPALAGTITVAATIDALGRVVAVAVDAEPAGLRAVADCVEARARRWQFSGGPLGSRIEIRYPFTLRPAGG